MLNDINYGTHGFKTHNLPLARIKKVMKADEDVKSQMISAEAPVIFAKACDMFIIELTMRAWLHASESKRRTLQRSDIAAALQKSDMYDFLIDVVPIEESHYRHNRKMPAKRAREGSPKDMDESHSIGYIEGYRPFMPGYGGGGWVGGGYIGEIYAYGEMSYGGYESVKEERDMYER